jgi:secretion/DNA translocation related TadE-like protein
VSSVSTVTPARRRGDAGAATLLVLAMAGVLLLVGAALGVVQAMVVAHRRAQAAADLAALAGASAVAHGRDPCGAADTVALLNGGRLVGCEELAGDVHVEVVVVGPRWLGQQGDLTAEARAGPS